MVFRKLGSKEIIYMPCHLTLVENHVLFFLLYVASKHLEKNDYQVPLTILKKFLNTTSTAKITKYIRSAGAAQSVFNEDQEGELFSLFCINKSSCSYSLSPALIEIMRSSYPLPNPFFVRALSCRYSFFFFLLCYNFKNNKKTPPISCDRILTQLNLEKTVFMRLKYLYCRVINKAIAEINKKTTIVISKTSDRINRSMHCSIKTKKCGQLFSACSGRVKEHVGLIDESKVDPKLFFDILRAFAIPEKSARRIVKDFCFITKNHFEQTVINYKTTTDNVIFVYRWLQSLGVD